VAIAVATASLVVSAALLGGHVSPLKAVTEVTGDHGLMIWNLWFVESSLREGKSPFHTDLVYYPLGARLSKHTLVAGYWPVTSAVRMLSGGDPLYPAYAYRASILLSFALTLSLAIFFIWRLGVPLLAAAAPAVQYAFCPFNQRHVPHLNHLSAAFFLPLTALAALRVFEKPSAARAAQLGLVLGAAVYFSELAAFLYLAVPVIVGACLAVGSIRPRLVATLRALGARGLGAIALAFAVTVSPFAASWAADSGKAPRSQQASNFSANAAGFVVPSPAHTPFYGRLFARVNARLSKGIGGHETFLGFPLLVFGLVALVRQPRGFRAVLAIVAAVFLVLSLGPVLKVGGTNTDWPMPYALLMKVPPFEMGRTPVRCVLFAVFCVAILASLGLADVLKATRRRVGAVAATCFAALVIAWSTAEVYLPGPSPTPYAVPAALEAIEPGPVLNLPLSVFDGYAVFLQTLHHQPIGTGFVSRRTPEQVEHVKRLDQLLERDVPSFVAVALGMGFRTIVLGPGVPEAQASALAAQAIRVIDLRDVHPPANGMEAPPDPGSH
jgi:hypothetical protein